MSASKRMHYELTDYPATRMVLGPIRASLNDAQIEQMLTESFPGASPEDAENFLRGLQKLGRNAGRVAQRALPGAIQGAAAGSALGPYGALFGALAGGATSALARGGGPQRPQPAPTPPVPPAIQAPPPLPATPIPRPSAQPPSPAVAARPGAGSSPATAQLLSLLSRPETMRALLSMLMGANGRSRVPVGQRQVPVLAFANGVAELASQAAREVAAIREDVVDEDNQAYLEDDAGATRCDVYNPGERAAVLVADLNEQAAIEWSRELQTAQELQDEEEARRERWTARDRYDDEADWPHGFEDESGFIEAYESALRGVSDYEYRN